MLLKTTLKNKPNHKLSKEESILLNEDIIDDVTDLAKLMFVLKIDLQWPQEEDIDLKQFVVQKIVEYFDGSGEMATQSCFDMALDYGFIVLETDPQTGFKKYRECKRNELDLRHDWFCFDCDVLVPRNGQQFLRCCKCPRIYHRKCQMEFQKTDQFICNFCNRVKERKSYFDYKNVNQERVNRLLRYLLDFVKNEMKQKYENVDKIFDNYVFVYKNMNLTKIRQKAELNQYKSLEEFDDDFFYYMHDISITEINFQETIADNFLLLRRYLTDEIQELIKCVDCYENVNNKQLKETNKEWICLPCNPFHRPVFAKCKRCPFWPAKVLLTTDKNHIEVCFFEAEKTKDKKKGGHQQTDTLNKCEVKSTDIREIDDKEVIDLIKDPMTDSAIEMIKSAIESKEVSNLDGSIDNVAKGLKTPSKSEPKSRVTAKTPVLPQTPQSSGTKPKKANKKKVASKTGNNPLIGSSSLSDDLSKDSVVDINPEKVADIPPAVDSMDTNSDSSINSKRRSGRIAAQTTPQKTETEAKKNPSKSIKNNKKMDQNKELDQSMQVDGKDSQQNMDTMDNNNQSVVDMNSKSGETTDTTLTDSVDKLDVLTFDLSTNKSLTERKPSLSSVTKILANTSISNMTSISPVMAFSASNSGQAVSKTSSDTDMIGKRFVNKYNELLEMSGPMIPKLEMEEKLVILNHYHNQQIDSLNQTIHLLKRELIQKGIDHSMELKEAKLNWWCAVCQKLGTHFCCVRFYCSRQCQLLDWANGHKLQCLTLKKKP